MYIIKITTRIIRNIEIAGDLGQLNTLESTGTIFISANKEKLATQIIEEATEYKTLVEAYNYIYKNYKKINELTKDATEVKIEVIEK